STPTMISIIWREQSGVTLYTSLALAIIAPGRDSPNFIEPRIQGVGAIARDETFLNATRLVTLARTVAGSRNQNWLARPLIRCGAARWPNSSTLRLRRWMALSRMKPATLI